MAKTNATPEKKSLKERAAELHAVRLPIMENRTKGDVQDLVGVYCTIRDYGFLPSDKNDSADYAVFIIDDEPKEFFFGGMVLTDTLHKLDDEGYGDEIRADGLPVLFTKVKSKNGQRYINVVLYPEQPDEK